MARIQSRVGLNTERIHGRKTKVQLLSRSAAVSFIDANHLMGFGGGKTFLGLHHSGELVAATAFSKIRFMKYENPPYYSVELERFCSLPNTTVIGGLDKLIKYYINHYNTNDIVTYIDKEWSDGKAYQKLGFEHMAETNPLYFSINSITYKRVLIDKSQTVKEPYYKIRNNGNLKLRKSTLL